MISNEKISFSVKKLPPKRKVLFNDEEEKVEKEYITQIVNGKFEGENTKNEGPLIIPLIKKHDDEDVNNIDNTENDEEEEDLNNDIDDIMDEKKYGLVKKGKKRLGKGKSKPILLKKKKYHDDLDENLKAELKDMNDVDPEAYEKVPIEQFGEALLRGMGWNPNSKENIKYVEGVKRPQRLGLGASELLELPKKSNVNNKKN